MDLPAVLARLRGTTAPLERHNLLAQIVAEYGPFIEKEDYATINEILNVLEYGYNHEVSAWRDASGGTILHHLVHVLDAARQPEIDDLYFSDFGNGGITMASLLVRHGANLNIADDNGLLPVAYAWGAQLAYDLETLRLVATTNLKLRRGI